MGAAWGPSSAPAGAVAGGRHRCERASVRRESFRHRCYAWFGFDTQTLSQTAGPERDGLSHAISDEHCEHSARLGAGGPGAERPRRGRQERTSPSYLPVTSRAALGLRAARGRRTSLPPCPVLPRRAGSTSPFSAERSHGESGVAPLPAAIRRHPPLPRAVAAPPGATSAGGSSAIGSEGWGSEGAVEGWLGGGRAWRGS